MANLTTLAAVKRDLFPERPPEEATSADGALTALIGIISEELEAVVGRRLAREVYTRSFDGNGRDRLVLPEYPVAEVSAVTVGGTPIPARVGVTGCGFMLADRDVGELALVGYRFERGVQNIEVAFTAGFDPLPAGVEQAVRETVVRKHLQSPHETISMHSAGGETTQLREPVVWPAWAFALIQRLKRSSLG